MASTIQKINLAEFAEWPVAERDEHCQKIYDQNWHRVYALSFWMTDNEMVAEELASSVFRRAFALSRTPSAKAIDRALMIELRGIAPVGRLTLALSGTFHATTQVAEVRRNTMRAHLERAVVQVPHTERLIYLLHDAEGYEHSRIASMLGISEGDSIFGLHQARLRIRQLVADMQNVKVFN